MVEPTWDLERVRTLALNNQIHLYRKRALDVLCEHLCETNTEAYLLTRGIVGGLQEDQFAHVVRDQKADVYGIEIDGRNWYLKFTIDENQNELDVISLHPLERPLVTRRGRLEV